jgi:hypothetical protein
MAVYYATTQQRIVGRLLRPAQIRGWIRGSLSQTKEDSGRKYTALCDPEDYRPTLLNHFNDVKSRCFTPSVASVITLSAPQLLLTCSLISLLLAIGVYSGYIWTRNLDTATGSSGGRNIMIVYLISVVACIFVYSISRLIQDNDPRTEEKIIHDYLQEYMKKHSDIVETWTRNPMISTEHV